MGSKRVWNSVFNKLFVFYPQPLIPSPFTPEDASQLLRLCLKGTGRSSAQVFCESIVVSDAFVNSCKGAFQQLMQEKAERVRVQYNVWDIY